MSSDDPLHIPVYPELLDYGLIILWGEVRHVVTFVAPTEMQIISPKGYNANAINIDPKDADYQTEIGPLFHTAIKLDLREQTVRDRIATAIWAKYRPNFKAPLMTSPAFYFAGTSDAPVWRLDAGLGVVDFVSDATDHDGAEPPVVISYLDNVLGSPERDLLALALITRFVFGGPNG